MMGRDEGGGQENGGGDGRKESLTGASSFRLANRVARGDGSVLTRRMLEGAVCNAIRETSDDLRYGTTINVTMWFG